MSGDVVLSGSAPSPALPAELLGPRGGGAGMSVVRGPAPGKPVPGLVRGAGSGGVGLACSWGSLWQPRAGSQEDAGHGRMEFSAIMQTFKGWAGGSLGVFWGVIFFVSEMECVASTQ